MARMAHDAVLCPRSSRSRAKASRPSRKISRFGVLEQTIPLGHPAGSSSIYYHKDPVREAAIRRNHSRRQGRSGCFRYTLRAWVFFRPPFFAPAPQVSPDGRFVLYTRHEIFDNRYVYADLYLWDLEKKRRAEADGARPRVPSGLLPRRHKDSLCAAAPQRPTRRFSLSTSLRASASCRSMSFPDGTLIDSFCDLARWKAHSADALEDGRLSRSVCAVSRRLAADSSHPRQSGRLRPRLVPPTGTSFCSARSAMASIISTRIGSPMGNSSKSPMC
jgi:hypothetical protein